MRLATMPDGTRDGALWVVSPDGRRGLSAASVAPNLLHALEDWQRAAPALQALSRRWDSDPDAGEPFDETAARAPLPRTWQWLDGSVFPAHAALMTHALSIDPIESVDPLMYQGMSHEFLAPTENATLWAQENELDFEGEFAVILRDVPAGVSASDALQYVALLTFVNDWSQRTLVRAEMMRKFGYIHGKPATGMAPLVATPDELGDAWRDGRLDLTLTIERNGERFGSVPTDEMDPGFAELIAYAARNRTLAAGTMIGSGTVSSLRAAEVGSACIAERRGLEIIAEGTASTPYLSDGEVVTMRVDEAGRSLFGELRQRVTARDPRS